MWRQHGGAHSDAHKVYIVCDDPEGPEPRWLGCQREGDQTAAIQYIKGSLKSAI